MFGKTEKHLKTGVGIMLVLVILGLAILLIWEKSTVPAGTDGGQMAKELAPPAETEISVLCAGDVMSHIPQISAQYDAGTGRYNYKNNFEQVKPYVEEADLALCNVETTFAGAPYTGFPQFSAPDALAGALKYAGFDVGITANNHMADKGEEGIQRTLNVLEKKGLDTVGSIKGEKDARYLITEVKGIKIGIAAYTYETGAGGADVFINGSFVPRETAAHINSFNFNTLKEDVPKIRKTVEAAKAAGAQVIIVYYHWGEEYQQSANAMQKKLAQETADMGADIIFASHPHVLQEAEYLTAAGTNRKVPVFYSLGNFLSNQRAESLGNRYTENGLMGIVNFTYTEGKGITGITMDGIPTWVDKYFSDGKTVFEIIPLNQNLEKNETLSVSGHLSRARQAREDANGLFEFDHEKH